MALPTRMRAGALTHSDVESENSGIPLFSRLQWDVLERLRPAGSGCQLSDMPGSGSVSHLFTSTVAGSVNVVYDSRGRYNILRQCVRARRSPVQHGPKPYISCIETCKIQPLLLDQRRDDEGRLDTCEIRL